MFTPWDLVRPRVWHPMASLEQSMMDLDRFSNSMLSLSHHSVFHGMHDDEFFSDLPVRRAATGNTQQSQAQAQAQHASTAKQAAAPEQQPQPDDPSQSGTFSSYTFSNSTIVDEKGQRVTSTRRRYEDSSGRLKAVHERQIGDKKLRSVWNKLNKDDDGNHERVLVGPTTVTDAAALDEFENEWKQTVFGDAEDKQVQKEALKEKGEHA